MNKGLEALKKIKQARYFVDFELDAKVSEDYKEELDIIENEIKRLKELEETYKKVVDAFYDWCEIKEKQDEILRIIKEDFYFNGFDEFIPQKTLSQEKIDLLKEWFK